MMKFTANLVCILIALILVGCQSAVPAETPTAPPSPTPEEIAGISGQVFLASDVSGQPDEPMADQLIVAVPQEAAASLLEVDDLPEEERPNTLQTTIQEGGPNLATVYTDLDGNYLLNLTAGDYVLCLDESNAAPVADFPASLRGCGLVSVPDESFVQVDIYVGRGGIRLER